MKVAPNIFGFMQKQWVILVLIGVGIATYINVLPNSFVWDDYINIVNNQDARQLHLIKLFQRNAVNNGLFYRPFALLYTGIFYALFKDGAAWHHLFQVGLHIVNAILLYGYFRKFFYKLNALFLSLIFLVHPMQVESVAFAAAFVGPLSFLFGILALHLIYPSGKKLFSPIGSTLLLLGSMLVKEQGVLFIPLALASGWLFSTNKNRRISILTICFVAFLVYACLRIFVGQTGFANIRAETVPIALFDVGHRLINIPEIVWYYLRTFLFPYKLAIDQQWVVSKITFWQFVFPFVVEGILFGLMFWYARALFSRERSRFRVFIFFGSWFVITLAFHLQVLPADMTVADRFFYLPIVGLLGVIGVYFEYAYERIQHNKNLPHVFFVGGVIVLLLLTGRTIRRNSDWIDEQTLYEHDLKVYDSFNVENNLGNIYLSNRRYEDALFRFQRSYVLFPTELNAYNIGYAYDLLRKPEDAIRYYEESLTYKKYPAQNNSVIRRQAIEKMVTLYLLERDYSHAQRTFVEHLSDVSTDGKLWQYFSISEYNLGNKAEALSALEKAKRYLSSDDTSSDYLYSLMQQNKQVTLIRSQ